MKNGFVKTVTRNPDRIPNILKKLQKYWGKYPCLRLGQLIINATYGDELYYIEDDRLIKRLEDYYGKNHGTTR